MRIQTPTVELVRFWDDALEILIYTKSTRLQGKTTLAEIMSWPMEKKLEHLAYMRDTIKSSWEFSQYIFEIHGVSRAFTHQFVRTRDAAGIDDPAYGMPDANPAQASFAQESQRTVDASDNGFVFPDGLLVENKDYFFEEFDHSNRAYVEAIRRGEPPQVARALLPTGVSTSIIAMLSLRALHHMAEVRLCTRTQGEYQNVFRMMRDAVIAVHPWTEPFINVFCVNHGTCCFPRYTKCPVQGPLFNPETGLRFDLKSYPTLSSIHEIPERPAKRSEIYEAWRLIRHEATPTAIGGKTM